MAQENVQAQKMQGSGQSHRISIALAIGATIGLIGLILLLYGLFGRADYSRSDNININLWWGLVMFVFGLIMAIGGAISARRQANAAPTDKQEGPTQSADNVPTQPQQTPDQLPNEEQAEEK
jgi:uncharacterized membrane protein